MWLHVSHVGGNFFFFLEEGEEGGEVTFLGPQKGPGNNKKHCLHLTDTMDMTAVIKLSIQHNTVYTFIITDGHSSCRI